ncbi:MAG: D-tyrosyl-tRNA(Tyr) deacylase [Elusimicrobia bacterium]|nr:D-tyrosyl-tRNA(Tyr) deacylase [Elusimicrobiota bacterium]
MRCVIQRVKKASVCVEGNIVSSVEKGLLVLLAVASDDTENDAVKTAKKISDLRIFSNKEGKFDHSVKEINGEILLVSQFTLYGDASKGRRPDFSYAADHGKANMLYEKTKEELIKEGLKVKTGVFAAEMEVNLINDGPVTVIYDTK